jgi:RimJ/RimL family protein N-acetyltransferase
MAVNRASRRVLEKAGLTHVGAVRRRWPEPLPGSELGEVKYEIARDAWEAATRWRSFHARPARRRIGAR